MNLKNFFSTKFHKNYSLLINGILIFFSIIVPTIIWFLLLFNFEKGAEASWNIGVGLFGSLIGGVMTFLTFFISSYQTKNIQAKNNENFLKDLRLNNLYLVANEYKLLISELYEFELSLKKIENEISKNNYNDEFIENYCDNLIKSIRIFKYKILIIKNSSVKDEIKKELEKLQQNVVSLKNSNNKEKQEERISNIESGFLDMYSIESKLMAELEVFYNIINNELKES
ncbi:hypothetical protein QTH16_04635 [Clostridium perfringens]|nr:hypothetical protein [Clostridium perfringens]